MWDRFRYYLDLFITLCGFDGSGGNNYFGWLVVCLSTLIVIYAFYAAISKAIWPGEQDQSHIKHQILDDA